jgi:hypothetical protein
MIHFHHQSTFKGLHSLVLWYTLAGRQFFFFFFFFYKHNLWMKGHSWMNYSTITESHPTIYFAVFTLFLAELFTFRPNILSLKVGKLLKQGHLKWNSLYFKSRRHKFYVLSPSDKNLVHLAGSYIISSHPWHRHTVRHFWLPPVSAVYVILLGGLTF